MYKILFFILAIVLTSCATKTDDSDNATVTGTRISKEEAQKLQLKPAGTLGDILRSQLEGIPQMEEGKTCRELVSELIDKGFEIKSVTDKEIIAISADNKSLKYSFTSGGCK